MTYEQAYILAVSALMLPLSFTWTARNLINLTLKTAFFLAAFSGLVLTAKWFLA